MGACPNHAPPADLLGGRMAKYTYIHCAECGRNKPHHAKGLCRRCYNCQYLTEHRAEIAGQRRQYRLNHREESAKSTRQWYRDHREEKAEYGRQRYRGRREESAEYNRQYRAAHPDKRRGQVHRRRALKRGATVGPVDEAAIYERDKFCIYCGATKDLTLDHLVPLSRGGAHIQDNLAVACRSCNSCKHTKTYDEFNKEVCDACLKQPHD